MRVTIRLFAGLREAVGSGELSREVAPGSTVATVWDQLTAEFPGLVRYTRSISSAVNRDYVKKTAMVGEGDEVAFLPPVSGG